MEARRRLEIFLFVFYFDINYHGCYKSSGSFKGIFFVISIIIGEIKVLKVKNEYFLVSVIIFRDRGGGV